MKQFQSSISALPKANTALDVLSLYFSGDLAMAFGLINASSPELSVSKIDFEGAVDSLIMPVSGLTPLIRVIK